MKYPKLKEIPTSRELVDVFKGYNHNLRIGDGEFYEMTNLSSDHYPVLSVRSKRGVYASPNIPQGLIAKDQLYYVDGTELVIGKGKERIEMELSIDDTPKNLISMGAYVIIMPDQKYINTKKTEERGKIEIIHQTDGTIVGINICQKDGSLYIDEDKNYTLHIGENPPDDTEEFKYWLNPHEETPVIQKHINDNNWEIFDIPYIKISGLSIAKHFVSGDYIEINGLDAPDLKHLNSCIKRITAHGNDFIVFPGTISSFSSSFDDRFYVRKKMPLMDFVIESGNRLWGCRFGPSLDGSFINEIYASALGDFRNWGCVEGVSTDSYVASVGTDGPFTGAITYRGSPIFFKENCMHTVYGSYPAQFQIQTTACRGVQNGCSKSLAIVNEVLYYKSRSGICSYDGSLPIDISSVLGDMAYHNAIAGTLGNKYYISMQDDNEKYHLFVCDTKKGLWHREDDTQAVDFCNYQGELYFIDYADNQIKTVKGTGLHEAVPIKWAAVTGILGTDSPDKKYISRIDVRMSLDVGTRVTFFAEYDSSGTWEQLFVMNGVKLQTFAVPIRPQRCDHMRLKIMGTGDAKIYSICKTIEQGSDV